MNVPTVVKNFLWRVCNNSLPTRDNLYKKKITIDPLCPICGLVPETSVHALWSCSAVLAVWMECPRKIQKLSIMESDGLLLIDTLMSLLEEVEFELVSFIARRIWLRRNSFVF